jgi:Uncharacterized protein conserved in bacteria (DUF2272)
VLLPLLAACAARTDPQAHVPPFARLPYQQFSRDAAVAIALREWRLFGMPVDDDPPGSRPQPEPDVKPERLQGLWQRVGEYWWLGLDAGAKDTRWTGKHDAQGRVFPPQDDEAFAWSAAFVSYVMRIAGAGTRFPYAAAHHTYIDAARQVSLGRAGWLVSAERPDSYAPQIGDLICASRTARPVTFDDLPAGSFPAHCSIVVGRAPGTLDVVGGNVDDAVTLMHVPVTAAQELADPGGAVLDARYQWFVTLRVLYAQ